MIYVTHDQVEAMTLADRIVALDQGNIQQIGAPLDLYAKPNNLFVAGFIGSPKMNFLPATVTGVSGQDTRLALDAAKATQFDLACRGVSVGDGLTLGIRPESVTIGDAIAGQISLPAIVETVERLGNITFAYLDIGAPEMITVQIIGLSRIALGQSVTLSIDPRHLHVFAASGATLRLEI